MKMYNRTENSNSGPLYSTTELSTQINTHGPSMPNAQNPLQSFCPPRNTLLTQVHSVSTY